MPVELTIVEAAALQGFLPPPSGMEQTWTEQIQRVHRPRIVDVVAGDERGIERAGTRDMECLIEQAGLIVGPAPVEDAVPPEVLRSDVRDQVLPLRLVSIGWRPNGIGTDMAEGA